jgi:DNA-binding FadR family transcriptional regulator
MDILSGRFPPLSLLPSETDLLKRFGVSRTVLREVIKTLTAKGLLVSRTRIGTTVQMPLHWNFFDRDVLSWKLAVGFDATFRDDLAEVRRAIEPRAAALAAGRRTVEQIAELRVWIERMRQPGHTRRSFAQADLGLHLAVTAASGNPLMRSIGGVIEAALVASFTLNSAVDDPDALADTLRRHEAIVDAIEAGRAEDAAVAMQTVIDIGTARTLVTRATETEN